MKVNCRRNWLLYFLWTNHHRRIRLLEGVKEDCDLTLPLEWMLGQGN